MLRIREEEMEELLAKYPEEFFPRRVLKLKGRQDTFPNIGRSDLLFEDQFGNNILMELKAVPAKLEVAEQLVKYQQAMEETGEKNVIMWLVAPQIPKHIADFLGRFGVEHTEIHESEFRQVARRHGFSFKSDTDESTDRGGVPRFTSAIAARGPKKQSTWTFDRKSAQPGSPEEFLSRCDERGKLVFSRLFERQKAFSAKTRLTWKHESGFSMQFYFPRMGFVEMVWGFPSMNREGKSRSQIIVFPFDFALRRGVSERFLESFGRAVSTRIPFTGGERRPSISVALLEEPDVAHLVETVFDFAEKAGKEQA